MTVHNNRGYLGAGTTGELLYSFDDDQVHIGEEGPVIYTIRDHSIYQGSPDFGMVRYQIDHDRVLGAGDAGGPTIMSANINLFVEEMETACLLVPILLDRAY